MAMDPIIFPEGQDVIVKGDFKPRSITYPAGGVNNAAVASDAAIETSKQRHRYRANYAQPNSTATAETRALHVARLPGTVRDVQVGSIAKAVGDSTVTVDIRKNGTTILTGVVTLNSSNTNRVAVPGTLSGSVTVAANDLLEAVIAISAGTGTLPTGVFLSVEVDENGQ
jgi:hypothetical protein